jgi:hypothetical protein
MEIKDVKLCINCGNFEGHFWPVINSNTGVRQDHRGACLKYVEYLSLVLGDKTFYRAKVARESAELCGVQGLGFTPKPVKVEQPEPEVCRPPQPDGSLTAAPVKPSFWRTLWPR